MLACRRRSVAAPVAPADLGAMRSIAAADPARRGPADTGSFPNLNIPPQAATAQFTPRRGQRSLRHCEPSSSSRRRAARRDAEEARRKRLKLLADEQDDTLKVIEDN